MIRACIVSLALMLGCSSGSRGGAATPLSSTSTLPPMFAHVPADSPYVLGTMGVQQHIRDAMYASADRKFAEALAMLEDVPDIDRAELEPWMRAFLVVIDELRGKDVKRWSTELGFDPRGQFLIYGVPLWPVMRVAVADAPKLRRIAKRVQAEAGLRLEEGTLDGRAYWLYRNKEAALVVAILDNELVASIAPPAELPKLLPLVLGVDKPRRSLRDVPTLTQLMVRHQLLPAFVGYVDTRTLATELLRAQTAAVPRACSADVDRLVGLVPRIVFGYRALDDRGMHFRTAVELPDSITTAIARTRTAVPALTPGPSGDPLVSFGVAARLEAVVALAHQATRHLIAQPFQCPWFAPIGDAARKVDALVSRPLPFGLRPLEGFSVVVDHFSRDPLAATARLLVVGAGANGIVNSLMRDVMRTATFNLPGDGSLVPIPMEPFGIPPPTTAHMTASGSRAAIAIGAESAAAATDGLAVRAPARSPLVSLGADMFRLKELGFRDDEDEDDDDGVQLRSFVLQLDVDAHGLVLDVFGRFP